MRAAVLWFLLCTSILLAALCLYCLPTCIQGAGIMALAFVATGIMFLKVSRGSK